MYSCGKTTGLLFNNFKRAGEDRCLHVALPVTAFPKNAYKICHHERNHCYSRWMCSAWDGSKNAL